MDTAQKHLGNLGEIDMAVIRHLGNLGEAGKRLVLQLNNKAGNVGMLESDRERTEAGIKRAINCAWLSWRVLNGWN